MPEWFERVRELTISLVRHGSVSGTEGEARFAGHLASLLAEHPYFRAHPQHLRVAPLPDGSGRANVFALVRGGRRTVVLAGHFDTVGVDGYGELADVAFEPERLGERLPAVLRRGGGDADRLALADLAGGEFMFGRGALDMKSGLAAGMAVLERAAAAGDAGGGVLLLATPDEEVASGGMRAAVPQLAALAREWGLEPVAGINLDAVNDRGDGGAGRSAFLGSVGKLLPFVYAVGRETHAGAPFDGVSAALLAAEVTRRVECSPALADSRDGEMAPPPVTLRQADTKAGYDVTTPRAAWCYYNQLTYGMPAREVLDRYAGVVEEAMADALSALDARRRAGGGGAGPAWRPRVLTVEELRRMVDGDATAGASPADGGAALDVPERCRRVVEELVRRAGLEGPAAVVGFASLSYPLVLVGGATAREARLREAVERRCREVGRETGAPIAVRRFFPGISDMSFLGGAASGEDDAVVAANTPGWGTVVHADLEAARRLAIPVVNVGPWGRDYHQRTERVHMPYSFETLPTLLWRLTRDVTRPE